MQAAGCDPIELCGWPGTPGGPVAAGGAALVFLPRVLRRSIVSPPPSAGRWRSWRLRLALHGLFLGFFFLVLLCRVGFFFFFNCFVGSAYRKQFPVILLGVEPGPCPAPQGSVPAS